MNRNQYLIQSVRFKLELFIYGIFEICQWKWLIDYSTENVRWTNETIKNWSVCSYCPWVCTDDPIECQQIHF